MNINMLREFVIGKLKAFQFNSLILKARNINLIQINLCIFAISDRLNVE